MNGIAIRSIPTPKGISLVLLYGLMGGVVVMYQLVFV